MHADVYKCVGSEHSADPAVEGDILMMRSVLLVEKQAHRITLNAKTRLNADKDIAKRYAADKKSVRFNWSNVAGKSAPAPFNALALPDTGDAVEELSVNGKAILFMCLNFVIRSLVKHAKQRFR